MCPWYIKQVWCSLVCNDIIFLHCIYSSCCMNIYYSCYKEIIFAACRGPFILHIRLMHKYTRASAVKDKHTHTHTRTHTHTHPRHIDLCPAVEDGLRSQSNCCLHIQLSLQNEKMVLFCMIDCHPNSSQKKEQFQAFYTDTQ